MNASWRGDEWFTPGLLGAGSGWEPSATDPDEAARRAAAVTAPLTPAHITPVTSPAVVAAVAGLVTAVTQALALPHLSDEQATVRLRALEDTVVLATSLTLTVLDVGGPGPAAACVRSVQALAWFAAEERQALGLQPREYGAAFLIGGGMTAQDVRRYEAFSRIAPLH